ncbi:MAG: S24/S26 family peptidase [Planctomycetia bacterium]|nr:S24/S26 family peptidase [Planctomycetia bacterium]
MQQTNLQKNVSMEEMFPLIEECLKNGSEIKFSPRGNSMYPMLRDQRDEVVLVRPLDLLKKDDLVFYRRSNGQFVLHRIIAVKNENEFVLCGDAQWIKEYPIYRNQIIGVVRAFYRRNQMIDCSQSKGYRLYCRVWGFLFPVRYYLFLPRRILFKLYRLLLK